MQALALFLPLSTEEGLCHCSSRQARAAIARGLLGGRAIEAWHLDTVGAGRCVSRSMPDGMGLMSPSDNKTHL